MAKLQTFTCDICGIHKKDTNHWYILLDYNNSFPPSFEIISFSRLGLIQSDRGLPTTTQIYHLCGELHLHSQLAELLKKKS